MCPAAGYRYIKGVVGKEDGAVSGVRRAENMDEREWRAALDSLPAEARARAELLLTAYGRLFERHRRVQRRHRALAAALDRVPLALMLIDGDEIAWANETADELLARGGPLSRRGPRLSASHDALQSALDAARSGTSRRVALRLEGDDECWQLLCLASPTEGPVLVAFCVGDGPSLEPRSDELQTLFGLTSREARVATLLLAGRTGREIAQDLDVGFETARSHVKHVLRKMGCPRQAAAVLALATSPATIGPEAKKTASGE